MKAGFLRKLKGIGSSSQSVGSSSEASFSSLVAAIRMRRSRRAQAKAKQTWSTTNMSRQDSSTCVSRDESSATIKKVRFASRGKRKTIPSCREMRTEEKEVLWYNPAERERMRLDARRAANRVKPKSVKDLNRFFMNAQYLATTNCVHDIEKVLRNRELLRKNTIHYSLRDVDEYDRCRGLEDYVSSLHLYDRHDAAKESILMVVRASRESSSQSQRSLDDIAQTYKEMSALSVILARLLAETDAIAAAQV